VAEATPRPLEVVWPPRKATKKKKKKQNEFELLGLAEATPNSSNLFFFFDGLLGWPDHPQRPGVASATPYRLYGVAEATP
jgi:hypothetical protein